MAPRDGPLNFGARKSDQLIVAKGVQLKDDYLRCISNSEKVSWKISDLFPEDYRFEFDKNFLPRSLTLEHQLTFLTAKEQLDLNHIRSASYINIFGFVEEYITAFMIRLASESSFEENNRLRALLRFSEEEVKHQTLFAKYVESFNNSFKVRCQFLSGADEVASVILSNSKLSVLLLTFHLEIITQQHYLESIRNDVSLDERFSEILKRHWMEEAQHAKLDLYELRTLAKDSSSEDFRRSVQEYFNIIDAFSGLLKKQVEMDLDSLSKCTGRVWSLGERNAFIRIQHYSHIYNFVILGLKSREFREELKVIFPEGVALLDEKLNSIEKEFSGDVDAA